MNRTDEADTLHREIEALRRGIEVRRSALEEMTAKAAALPDHERAKAKRWRRALSALHVLLAVELVIFSMLAVAVGWAILR